MNETLKSGHGHRESVVQKPNQAETVIRAEGLGKTYAEGKMRTPVFDGLDLSVATGETVAIVGASGAGKSTLLHLLGGLDIPTAGEVYVAGERMSALSDGQRGKLRNQALGFVYQFHHLLPEFTALENVMMPVLLSGKDVSVARGQALQLLESVGLGHRIEHKPSELSGGERQRCAVARALVNKPGCVLGDEPTGNLDDKTAGTVFELMLELNRAQRTSLVLVTHDRSLARRLDRVLELHQGKLRELAPSAV
ncbi:lipoprotein-releasing ABC transporter ATP-binding protein LolD [Xanthomonas vesicatoria]|uniref:Lipoprotein-releasing system ATP-binding protein LolD n=1 Tax=Xanthomonas vesicatoria ATCC 35937 TaxID=925775 RepID=F0BHP4_9XANT|nr:lipoprotein-releasing ABC transporter ATP-binding protein LolD [Xanthomonas vesicatoria]EGD08008.1 lipoprotein releasing system, ATP-binding protein [Xanthomonas vesicatoria ATCC 35937]KTF35699.1 lipoprotein ABC transporter ATP-binding protein [Xanthomonas vesicatoria]KTF39018.1 lipoprotein ABC transporter ATP-binding protein [Xanthomonas vesicatoria]MCC8558741.1 lipoprotein-releasing ABC transporter ATP-binding protein LolD [Xanthomonas vesicatoria]MCC8595621.1 lipoprotein-releasing ABC tr